MIDWQDFENAVHECLDEMDAGDHESDAERIRENPKSIANDVRDFLILANDEIPDDEEELKRAVRKVINHELTGELFEMSDFGGSLCLQGEIIRKGGRKPGGRYNDRR